MNLVIEQPDLEGKTPHQVLRTLLEILLTVRNASSDKTNPVIPFCVEYLRNLDREVIVDEYLNIYSPPPIPWEPGQLRGVVAHTDAVQQNNGEDIEPVIFADGIFYSKFHKRPIGGDDKVGIAIALTIAKFHPEYACILPSDEEIGCVGSKKMNFPEKFNFLVQPDRRGTLDLVHTISGTIVLSPEAQEWAKYIVPHRDVVTGATTDVGAILSNGYADNATNLSCGYFNPHSANEFVVLSFVWQTLLDTYSLLRDMPFSVAPAKKAVVAVTHQYSTQGPPITPQIPAKNEVIEDPIHGTLDELELPAEGIAETERKDNFKIFVNDNIYLWNMSKYTLYLWDISADLNWVPYPDIYKTELEVNNLVENKLPEVTQEIPSHTLEDGADASQYLMKV